LWVVAASGSVVLTQRRLNFASWGGASGAEASEGSGDGGGAACWHARSFDPSASPLPASSSSRGGAGGGSEGGSAARSSCSHSLRGTRLSTLASALSTVESA